MAGSPDTIVNGLYYQHLYSAYELLALLDPESPYDHGCVENPDTGSADDVTLSPKNSAKIPRKLVQVKWHVDHRDAYSFENLTTAEEGKRSLLKKLFDSWKALTDQDNVEIWLVSNYGADQKLGKFIWTENGTLTNNFIGSSPFKDWVKKLSTTDAELERFCKVLQFRLSFGTVADLHDRLDDRMGRHGLRVGTEARTILRDMINEWVRLRRTGKNTNIDAQRLRDELFRRNLYAPREERLDACLWIHGWAKKPYDGVPDREFNFTALGFHHDTKQIPPPAVWEDNLSVELRRARDAFRETGKTALDIRGLMPLSLSLLVGRCFSTAGGFTVRTTQKTDGLLSLWRSDVAASSARFELAEDVLNHGDDVLVVFAISNTAIGDWEKCEDRRKVLTMLTDESKPEIRAILTAAVKQPGRDAIRSNRDAIALVDHARDILDHAKKNHQARRIHLILIAPAGFALFLGQRLNALGDIITYERTVDEQYRPAMTIKTG